MTGCVTNVLQLIDQQKSLQTKYRVSQIYPLAIAACWLCHSISKTTLKTVSAVTFLMDKCILVVCII